MILNFFENLYIVFFTASKQQIASLIFQIMGTKFKEETVLLVS